MEDSAINVSLYAQPDETLVYTLDGSDPHPNNLTGSSFSYKNVYPSGPMLNQGYISYLYNGPITVSDRSNQNNSVSMKASAGRNTPDYFPSNKVKKATPLRAQVFKEGYLPSEIITHTYFIFPNSLYSMPIHSVVLPEKDLFDYNTGIYTPGIHYDTISTQHPYCARGNYYLKDYHNRNGSFEYFENGERKVAANMVIDIQGGCSTQNPRKSLRLKAKNHLDYPIFKNLPDNRYEHLVIRSGGNEDDASMIRDVLFADLSRKLDYEYMETTPSISFLNGEYWGIAFLRERIADNYLESRTGVNKDHIDLIEFSGGELELKEGSLDDYNAMIQFLQENSLSNANNF